MDGHSPAVSAVSQPAWRRALTLLLLAATSAPAQLAGTGTGPTVRGIVHTANDSVRLAYAIVELASVGTRTTDSAGTFTFASVHPGRYALHVRRLGFVPYDDTLTVAATDTVMHRVGLTQLPEVMRTVVIRGELVAVPKGFEHVYRRGAHSFGYFMTAEQIAERNPLQTRDLLVNIPGVITVGNTVTFERCQKSSPGAGGSTFEGSPQVYVDGQRVTRFSRQFSDELEAALAQVEPRQIQAIEVYTGLSQIPGDFASQACAAIAIWTKRE